MLDLNFNEKKTVSEQTIALSKYAFLIFLLVMELLNSSYLGNNPLACTCGNGSLSFVVFFSIPFAMQNLLSPFSPHLGITYGFNVMLCNESPNIPFTVFRTRFTKGIHQYSY